MKRRKNKFILLTSLLFSIMGGYTVYRFSKRPRNNPKCYQKEASSRQKIVACLGDSHTQGTMAHNFVNDLIQALSDKGYSFINAGVNGDLVYNVLSRVNEVISCHPDYVIILIGTNDILARLSKSNEIHFEVKKHLPQQPTEEWFIENLRQLITVLKQKTSAKIAILSLPLISEDTDSLAFKAAVNYSHDIFEVASEMNVTYLPLNEKQLNYFEVHRPRQNKSVVRTPLAYFIPSFKHYILRKSWEQISEEAGLSLTIDTVHQNKVAAEMIEQLIIDFLENSTPS